MFAAGIILGFGEISSIFFGQVQLFFFRISFFEVSAGPYIGFRLPLPLSFVGLPRIYINSPYRRLASY